MAGRADIYIYIYIYIFFFFLVETFEIAIVISGETHTGLFSCFLILPREANQGHNKCWFPQFLYEKGLFNIPIRRWQRRRMNFYKASYCTVLNTLQFSSDKVCVYNFSCSLIMSIMVNHLRSLLEDCMEYTTDTK